MTCLKFKGGTEELSHTSTSKTRWWWRQDLNPVQTSFIQFKRSPAFSFALPPNLSWVDTQQMHYGQEAARGACTQDSRCRNSTSSWKGKLEFSISLSKIKNYYFLNNKKSVLSGRLNAVKHMSLNVAKLGQDPAAGQPICYQPHENKVKHTSQTILCTINKN